jgi:uncharacterized protein YcbK (DUF882 family)
MKKNKNLFIGIIISIIIYLMTKKKSSIPHSYDEQLTKNFTLKEFHSHDGSDMPYDVYLNIKKLAVELQKVRDMVGLPLRINSGYRSPALNARTENAASNSYHMKGMAADISSSKEKASSIYSTIHQMIEQGSLIQGGLGSYNTFTHYDIRGTKARW